MFPYINKKEQEKVIREHPLSILQQGPLENRFGIKDVVKEHIDTLCWGRNPNLQTTGHLKFSGVRQIYLLNSFTPSDQTTQKIHLYGILVQQ